MLLFNRIDWNAEAKRLANLTAVSDKPQVLSHLGVCAIVGKRGDQRMETAATVGETLGSIMARATSGETQVLLVDESDPDGVQAYTSRRARRVVGREDE